MKTNTKTIKTKFITISFILVVIIVYFFTLVLNNIEKKYLNEANNTYNMAYNIVYNQNKEIADFIFGGLEEVGNTNEIFKTLKEKDILSKNEIRKVLYSKIIERYKVLKSKYIENIIFVLADNTIFLEMENPRNHSIKIDENRELINSLQKYKKPLDSYEITAQGEGFKFLYPIMDNDSFLGFVEIIFASEAITLTIMKNYNVWSNFFINEKNFNKELLKNKTNLYKKSHISGYINNLNVLREVKKMSTLDMNQRLPSKDITNDIYNNMRNKIFKSYFYQDVSHVFTTIPIINKITKDQEAVLVVRSENKVLAVIYDNRYYVLMAILSILVLLIFILYQKIIKNISEQEILILNNKKEKEHKLELQNLFDSAQVGLMYVSKDRVVRKVNKKIVDILGYESKEEMIGLSTRKFHINEDRYIEYGKLNVEALKNGQSKNIDYELRRKDGTSFWCEVSGKAMDNASPPDLEKGFIWVINDISERKIYENEIQKQKEEYETIFNYSQDGITVTDLEGNFLESNMEFLKLTGFTKKELLTKNCNDLTIKEDRKKNIETIKNVIDTNTVRHIEKKCIFKDDKIVLVNTAISLLPDKKRLLLLIHDNTTLKVMHEQSKLAAMGEMIGNIAHQWRQPLSTISVASTGAKIQKELGVLTDEELYSLLDAINNSAQYLSSTIDDFRGFFNPSNSKMSEFVISDTFEKTLNLVSTQFYAKDIKVIKNIEDIFLVSIENELIQVFVNILNNARDALLNLEKESKYIFIRAYKEEKELVIEIKDNAKGISEDIIEKIFDPYFTTKHQSQGTGIGLYMSAEIIRTHLRGTIIAQNTSYTYKGIDCKGAKFIIKIPLA